MVNIMKATAGVLIFIFGLLLTVKGWWIIAEFPNFLDTNIQIVMFWVGLLVIWVMCMFIAPYYLITSATKQ